MIIDLTGGKVVVTGSTVGIGRATAERLAQAGASAAINGRGSERVDAAVHELRQAFSNIDISGVAMRRLGKAAKSAPAAPQAA